MPEEPDPKEQPPDVDVYVAGGERDGDHSVAKYWKNGVEVILPSTGAVEIRSIYVSGSDVYVVGWEKEGDGNGVVTYWKNNEPTHVTDGSHDAIAFAITVSGTDVYIAGTEGRFVDSIYYIFPTYWKNGNPVNLTDGLQDGGTFDIKISGDDIYVAGTESEGFGYFATYWKNGAKVRLTNPLEAYVANSIAVAGDDLYVAGTGYLADGHTIGKLWKNDIDVNLTDNVNSEADCVTVSNNDVYVCGSEDQIAKYYKNGSPVTLDSPGSFAKSIALNNIDVYVAGTKNNGTHLVAVYWKNGSAVNLTDGTKDNYASDIALSAR